MTNKERAAEVLKAIRHQSNLTLVANEIEKAITAAVEAEREACAQIAEAIRKRKLAGYTGANCPYHATAEEIRDRIRLRPENGVQGWSKLDLPDS